MSEFDYQLFVIGAGSGGVRAARMAANEGVKVGMAEEKYLGGTCVNVGCVPKKLMVYASHFAEDFHDAKGFGWDVGETKHSWQTLINHKNREIERLNGIYRNLLESAGVMIHDGRARLTGPHSVEVDGQSYTAEKILLTVGCTPNILEFDGNEHVISSDDVFYLKEMPKRIVIVGGGYIAVEFAGIFNALGAETHVVYRGDRLLKSFDHSTAEFAANEMQKKGVHFHYLRTVDRITKTDVGLICELNGGEKLVADQVMYATGRYAISNDLGLETTKVVVNDNATIKVNEQFQTDEPSVYALGDVIGTPELTPVALAQAMVFLNQQYGDNSKVMSYDSIPTAVFCQPNMATVGITEEQALKQNIKIDVYLSDFKHLKSSISGSKERVYMKMIVEQGSQKVLGMHMVGPDAAEVIQGFAVAVKAGLTKSDIDQTIGIHPSAAEEFVTMRQASYSK